MAIKLGTVTFDCADPGALATFWAQVTGWDVAPEPNEFVAMVGGPNRPRESPGMLFLKVPEGKSAKNRMHLDLACDDIEAEKARLLALGATHVHDKEEWGVTWTTFLDPEGNEFCVGLHPELFEGHSG